MELGAAGIPHEKKCTYHFLSTSQNSLFHLCWLFITLPFLPLPSDFMLLDLPDQEKKYWPQQLLPFFLLFLLMENYGNNIFSAFHYWTLFTNWFYIFWYIQVWKGWIFFDILSHFITSGLRSLAFIKVSFLLFYFELRVCFLVYFWFFHY